MTGVTVMARTQPRFDRAPDQFEASIRVEDREKLDLHRGGRTAGGMKRREKGGEEPCVGIREDAIFFPMGKRTCQYAGCNPEARQGEAIKAYAVSVSLAVSFGDMNPPIRISRSNRSSRSSGNSSDVGLILIDIDRNRAVSSRIRQVGKRMCRLENRHTGYCQYQNEK